jgi:hypothetical protein
VEHVTNAEILATVEKWPEAKRYLFHERAGILEFQANMPRDEAERLAYEQVTGKQLALIGDGKVKKA